jgi:hypothetical protein
VAQIDSPVAGATLGSTISVTGSAAGYYTLSYGNGEKPSSWTEIASGFGGVAHGLLGTWDTDSLQSGVYTLRLEVSLPGSPTQSALTTVRIDHERVSARLILPAPDSKVSSGSTVQLLAETSGAVRRVEFVVDGQVVGSTEQGNSWSWLASGAGRHTVEVAAVDADGKRVVSSPVSVLVE